MSYRTGPKIVTDGLVLCLDAADRNSYPGSGSTWYDLSGQNNHGSINNCTFANGVCYFDGTNDYIECNHSSSLSMTSEITIEYSVKPIWDTPYTPIIDKRNGPSGTENYSTWIGNDKLLDYIARPDSDKRPLVNGTSIFTSGNWYIIQITVDTSGNIKCYINSQKFDTTGGAVGPSNTSPLVIGGINNSSGVTQSLGDGYIGYVKIHNIALKQNELLQNYNATKGRFGL